MFGLSTLATRLIIYGVMFAAASAAFIGFVAHERTIGADNQKKKDDPIIAAAEKRAVDAEAANLQFKKDFAVLDASCKATAATVTAFSTAQDTAITLSAKILAQQIASEQRTAGRIMDLKAKAATPQGGGCDEKATDLRSVAADLLRGESPGTVNK